MSPLSHMHDVQKKCSMMCIRHQYGSMLCIGHLIGHHILLHNIIASYQYMAQCYQASMIIMAQCYQASICGSMLCIWHHYAVHYALIWLNAVHHALKWLNLARIEVGTIKKSHRSGHHQGYLADMVSLTRETKIPFGP